MSNWYIVNDELRSAIAERGGKLNRVIALRETGNVEITQLTVSTAQGYCVAYVENGEFSFAVNMRAVVSIPASFSKFHNIFDEFKSKLALA